MQVGALRIVRGGFSGNEEPVAQSKTQRHYMICYEVDRLGRHVYEIHGRLFMATAYPKSRESACKNCPSGRIVVVMDVQNFDSKDWFAPRNNWTHVATIFPRK
jgi:hypothetical protein